MKKRKRKYRCAHCKKIQLRVSDKQWIKSDCDKFENGQYSGTYITRLILIQTKKP